MPIEKLYEQYGSLMIQLEILQSKINEVKKQIVESINAEAATKSTDEVKE